MERVNKMSACLWKYNMFGIFQSALEVAVRKTSLWYYTTYILYYNIDKYDVGQKYRKYLREIVKFQ